MALTQGIVLSFLLDHGGRVKNSELLSNFKEFINCTDPMEKGRNRDLFKSFVNTVAVVKQKDDEKYVVVKKKYKEHVKGKTSSLEAEIEHSVTSLNSSLASPAASEPRGFSKSESDTIHNADVLNNNSSFCTVPYSVCCISNSASLPARSEFQADCDVGILPLSTTPTSGQEDFLTVLNISNDTIVAKGGSVFAVVAIKSPSPPHSQPEHPSRSRVKYHHKAQIDYSASLLQFACSETRSLQVRADMTIAAANSSSSASDVADAHELYGSPSTKRRHSVAPDSPAPKRGNKVTTPRSDAKQLATFPLEPREHEWLVMSATGQWSQIYRLLLQDIKLAEKRNFVSGFTALHWAAKKGNSKMVRKIIRISRLGGPGVDINTKSYDGYTPLHIAAIHSHESVLSILARDYGANCNIRDNSGKKPYHYLNKDASPKLRELLGDPRVLRRAGNYKHSDHDQNVSDPPKGFSTLTKLFQSKHRKKLRPSFSLDQDEDRMFQYN